MKKILIPTDFSSCAVNAVDFAIRLFSEADTKFYILNAFEVTSSLPELPDSIYEEVKDYSEKALAIEKNRIMKEFGINENNIETIARSGRPVYLSKELIQKEQIDAVVLGTTGATGAKELLVGSTAGKFINQVKATMFIVPQDAQFKPFESILYTTNLQHEEKENVLQPLTDLLNRFNGSLRILHATETEGELATYQTRELDKLLDWYKGHDAQYVQHFAGEKIDECISDYMNTHNIDLLAMVPRHYNIVERLFHYSISRKMAYHSHTPILIMSKYT